MKEKKVSNLLKKQVLITGISIFLTVVVMLTGSYALFTSTSKSEAYNVLQVGTFQISYVDLGEGLGDILRLADAFPIPDTEGKVSKSYRFDVQNTGTLKASYKIKLVDDSSIIAQDGCADNQLSKSNLKYQVDQRVPELLGSKQASGYVVYEGTLSPGSSRIHEVRMWIDENSDNSVLGKHFHGKVVVEGIQDNTADEAGASAPELGSNMIPVKYDKEKQSWVKANVKNYISNPWYNYQDQMWANAVTVSETNRASYQSASAGTVIPMSDILQMLVWIPRYRYAIPTGSGAREISIQFEDKNTGKSAGTAVGDSYLTHPAFTFGTKELNGIWVGKFEMDGTESALTIKPNEQSFTNKTVSQFFTLSRNMQSAGNAYGYPSTGINTHMMRNSEWGAVSYLTQSKYGRCTAGICEEVTINNINANSGRSITGCAADTVTAPEIARPDCPETNRYQTEKGVKASTTGNIYGIYDMSGGSWDYTMGNYSNYSGYTAINYTAEQAKTILGRTDNVAIGIWNSGFNGPVYGKALDGITNLSWTSGIPFPEQKYYDLYTTDNVQTACNGKACLGYGLSEVAGWNSDHSNFVSPSYPWFIRGGRYVSGALAGVFAFSDYYGDASGSVSFRLVVSNE